MRLGPIFQDAFLYMRGKNRIFAAPSSFFLCFIIFYPVCNLTTSALALKKQLEAKFKLLFYIIR